VQHAQDLNRGGNRWWAQCRCLKSKTRRNRTHQLRKVKENWEDNSEGCQVTQDKLTLKLGGNGEKKPGRKHTGNENQWALRFFPEERDSGTKKGVMAAPMDRVSPIEEIAAGDKRLFPERRTAGGACRIRRPEVEITSRFHPRSEEVVLHGVTMEGSIYSKKNQRMKEIEMRG